MKLTSCEVDFMRKGEMNENQSKRVADGSGADPKSAGGYGICVVADDYFHRKRAVQTLVDVGVSVGVGLWGECGRVVLFAGE